MLENIRGLPGAGRMTAGFLKKLNQARNGRPHCPIQAEFIARTSRNHKLSNNYAVDANVKRVILRRIRDGEMEGDEEDKER